MKAANATYTPIKSIHGSAAALALIIALERINGPHFGEPKIRDATHKMLRAHFEAYSRVNAASKRGFMRVFGDWVASAAAGCTASEPQQFYAGRRWLGRKLNADQRKAHARVWVEARAK